MSHSFTPRTCLWPLTGALVVTFVLSIGLTFRSDHACYAGVCGEWLFPLQARLHVVVWYCWLGLSVTILALRAFHPSIQAFLRTPIVPRRLPLLGKELHLSGALVTSWIIALYAIVTAIWWRKLDTYFVQRGNADRVTSGNHILAAIALTGHYADITMGMALIPVSRHSALASFFKLSVSTTLTFHMLTAYVLFSLVLSHSLLYVAWLPTLPTLNLHVLQPYPILEPTYRVDEVFPGNTSSLGIWRASLVFTGLVAALILAVLAVTTLPSIRSRHFNVFYFTHLTSILAVVIVCLHASTMFYCTAPGLAMITLDWIMRLYDLKTEHAAKVVHLGRGWYSLSVELPRQRLRGCSCKSPLAHFYIQHGATSWRELHPFTTTTHLITQDSLTPSQEHTLSIGFLFRKSRLLDRKGSVETIEEIDTNMHPLRRLALLLTCRYPRKKFKHGGLQWTEKLGMVADQNSSGIGMGDSSRLTESMPKAVGTMIRFEGPYFTPASPQKYHTVLCIVAGTGISGALAIAAAFAARWDSEEAYQHVKFKSEAGAVNGLESERSTPDQQHIQPSPTPTWRRLVICWSVRVEDYIELPYATLKSPGIDVRPCLTGGGRARMNVADIIRQIQRENSSTSMSHHSSSSTTLTPQTPQGTQKRPKSNMAERNKIWAYISGPNRFIDAAEAACKQQQVDCYGARWDI